jgi:hypothetical protein
VIGGEAAALTAAGDQHELVALPAPEENAAHSQTSGIDAAKPG